MATVDSAPPAGTSVDSRAARRRAGSVLTDDSSAKSVGRIGPWQLAKLLHEGDLARVYLAQPADGPGDLPPHYVLKVLRKEWWRDPLAIEMQRRAAWAGRQASHPHLLPVLAAGVDQPPFYLVSPRIHGRPLSTILESQGRFAPPTALWIGRQVAEALDALHVTTRMIHADVKPANVLVGGDGHATLIDLGFVHAPQEGRHWSTRPVFGTLNYLAPECLSSSLGASPQSDLYSLGVMLYELLAGVLPFAGKDAEQLLRQHRESQPPPLERLRPDLPATVAGLVRRLLSKDPLRRPADAAAVVEELTRLEIECFAIR